MPLTDFYLNNDVSKLTGISQRQILSWTEKRLIKPERPARKAGTRRGYNYFNLLEFGLAKYLIEVLNVQFFTAHQLLEELREDGEFFAWATNYKNYCLSFARRISERSELNESGETLKSGDLLTKYHARANWDHGEKVSETVAPGYSFQPGTLYYIFCDDIESIKGAVEGVVTDTVRIISPWGFEHCMEDFSFEDTLRELLSFKGMHVVNLGKIKADIDRKIREKQQ